MPSTLDELLKIARHAVNKRAFVDAAAASGQMPPAGGMDPAAMGGAPPPTDPAAASSGGGSDPALTAKLDQLITMMGQGGGAGGAGAGALKPKIDVNVEIMQIKNILAKVVDALGIPVPAQDMVATPDKLTAMAQGQSVAAQPGAAPAAAGGAGGAGGSAIPPIDPMQGASPALAGGGGGGGGEKGAADMLMEIGVKAAAVSLILEKRSAKR